MVVTAADRTIDIPDDPRTPLVSDACSKEAERPARVLIIASAATAVTIGERAGSSCSCCRVCLKDATTLEDPLISSCLCTRSTSLVHRQCLLRWRATKAGSPAYFRCARCHYKYHFYRLWWGAVLRNKNIVVAVFLLLVLSAVALLGYCPIIQSIIFIPRSPNFNPILHFANGMIIFVLTGCIGMLVTVCCCCTVPKPAAGHPDTGCESCVSCRLCDPGPCRQCGRAPDRQCVTASGCSCIGGDECDGLCLMPRACCVVCVLAPIGGPVVACAAYVRWYTWVSWLLHTVEVMVENVGPVASRKRAVARAARERTKEAAAAAKGSDTGAGAGGKAGTGGAEAGAATQAPAAACMV